VNLRTLTERVRHVITFRNVVNKLALSARLGHSCETG